MKRVCYIANMRLPSERAHSVQVMRMCLAFARIGAHTTLYVPSRRVDHAEDPFAYYGIESAFDIRRLWSIDLFRYKWMPHVIAYWVNALTFVGSLVIRIRTFKNAIIFSRDPISSFVLSWLVKDVIYEIHDAPKKNRYNRWFLKRVTHIVATNTWKKNILVEEFDVDPKKIVVAHHGVDAELFAPKHSLHEARLQLGLDQDGVYVVYTGHLYDWKGVYTLARAAQLLPKNVRVLMVGGTTNDVEAMRTFCEREHIENVIYVGFQKHERVPLYLAAADALVIPTSARYTMGKFESSPLKLFEYAASGKPIVASDLPAIRDIVDDAHVYFMKPDSATECARVIQEVLAHPHTKGSAAQQLVAQQTWEQRACDIMKHISA